MRFHLKKRKRDQKERRTRRLPKRFLKRPGGFGRVSDEKLVGPLTFGEADKKSAFDPAALSERVLQEQGERGDKISVPETGAKRSPPVGNGVCEFYIDGRGLVRKVDKPLGLGERVKQAVASFLSVSLAAQIGTAPVLLASFGYVSLWSLLLNCLFVPLIGARFRPSVGFGVFFLSAAAWRRARALIPSLRLLVGGAARLSCGGFFLCPHGI